MQENISLTFIGTSNFNNNSAGLVGGAIRTVVSVVLNFTGTKNNSAKLSGGAISISRNSVLAFTGINNFISNLANGYRGNPHIT